ncbi:hypothetical protein Dsin_028206 [Dipteronia sinensis]|uniref:40S ribosomal protein S12 n=1 Tax=Dipteronia sinensis TaxID=43782 RepID=A0AAD9ZQS7_9ROSI|nr:hypothetical protein Dsin_028206 [Dipteronia sinensis]
MSGEEAAAPAPAPVVEAAAPPLGEAMDLMTGLQIVLRKSLANGGLARGLHEGAKVIEKNVALLCVLADDCNQPDYVKLVKALCADHNVSLLTVPSAKTLGEWAGVSITYCHFFFNDFAPPVFPKHCLILPLLCNIFLCHAYSICCTYFRNLVSSNLCAGVCQTCIFIFC